MFMRWLLVASWLCFTSAAQPRHDRRLPKFRAVLHKALKRKAAKDRNNAKNLEQNLEQEERKIFDELLQVDDMTAELERISEDELFEALFGSHARRPPPVPAQLKYLEQAWPKLDDVAAEMSGSSSTEEALSARATGSRAHVVYGELSAASVVESLALAHVRRGERFYDLGSGGGKVVAMAWLLGLRATGVELLSKRFTSACDQCLRKLHPA